MDRYKWMPCMSDGIAMSKRLKIRQKGEIMLQKIMRKITSRTSRR
jgi:hypothetical protein